MFKDSYVTSIIGGALIVGLILLGNNVLEPGTWHEPLFFTIAIAVITIWNAASVPPHIKLLHRRIRKLPIPILLPWILFFTISAFGLVFTFNKIPLFVAHGIWAELTLLAFLFRIYHVALDYVLAWYVKRVDSQIDE